MSENAPLIGILTPFTFPRSYQLPWSRYSQLPPIATDDVEDDLDFGFDMDDILAGSSPSRRISFSTSSERDTPFVRPPVRLFAPRVQPQKLHKSVSPLSSAFVGSDKPRPTEVQIDRTHSPAPISTERSASPARQHTRTPSLRAASPPETRVGAQIDDDALPPSSPLSSPLSSPSRPGPSDPSFRSKTPAQELQESDLTLPPSSPIPIPSTPLRDTSVGMDLFASPPSPTLDALRITSRVALRSLLNPVSIPIRTSVSVTPPPMPSPALSLPIASPSEVKLDVNEPSGDVPMNTSDIPEADEDVTPLVLDASPVDFKVEIVEEMAGFNAVAERAEVVAEVLVCITCYDLRYGTLITLSVPDFYLCTCVACPLSRYLPCAYTCFHAGSRYAFVALISSTIFYPRRPRWGCRRRY